MQDRQTQHASWQELLASPASAAPHVVQICDGDDFLVTAVAYFAAEGLRAGETVLLYGTQAHLRGVQRALAATGADAEAARRSGQLQLADAAEAATLLRPKGRLDPARFEALAGEALRRAHDNPRFAGVRWWGEVSNVLHQHGYTEDALAAEELAGAACRRYDAHLFCSYLLDRFDPQGYDGMLREVCCRHTHVIPAEDYVRHRMAVNRAVAEVIGEIRGPLLQSLLSWKGLGCQLPSSQALLFWVRDALPEYFPEILARARTHQAREAA